MNLKNKKILITGAAGFLGTHLITLLKKEVNKKYLYTPTFAKFDLRDIDNCKRAVKDMDIVIHLAAKVGGIGYNQKNPGELFYDNAVMGIHLMEESRKTGVGKFVAVGTICAYPKYTPIPFKEKDLWNGYPEETNAAYGLAKKMLLVQGQAYRSQYGFNSIFLLPVNLYGPGDNFDPGSLHVIPALIKKFTDAVDKKQNEVIVWGTGKPTREFLFVRDAARAIILATKRYDKPEPVNIGSSSEISIRDLANTIKELTGFDGKIVWDKTKPDGQPRRKLNISKAYKEFGFKSKITFAEGLKETIQWYTDNKDMIDQKDKL